MPFEAQGRLTVDEASVARHAVLAGLGIGYFIEESVAEDIAAGRLVRLLSDWTPERPGLCIYYPQRRNPSAGFTAFVTLVREAAQGPIP
jgi:DNA-binding transcriptional LysR family regulator